MSVPARPPRDRRLDVIRGWMQVSIFVSHVVGTGFAWLIHAAWGLSDSSEQFVFLSGLGLGSVFALKAARDGFAAGAADLGRRVRRLYLIHLLVVALLAAAAFGAEAALRLPGEAATRGWMYLAEAPLPAVAALLAMLYQPEFTGILPVFVWCMLLLPGFMLLAGRIGAAALLPSALLWAGVQAFGWEVSGLGGRELEFNPLAWQFIFLLGAWCGRAALLAGAAPRRPDPRITAAALAVVGAGVAIRAAGHLGIDPWDLSTTLLDGKEKLAWPRLLHALALAWLVAAVVPRDAAWMRGRTGQALAAVGRNSLEVFSLGLLLALGASLVLRLHPGAAMLLDPVVVVGGAALLVAFAHLLERRRAGPAPAGPAREATG
jgi:hypothetical protein